MAVKLLLERTSGVPLVIFCFCLYRALTCLLKENNVSGFACFPSHPCCIRYLPCCHGAFTARGIQGVSLPLLLVSRQLRYFDLCEILQPGNLVVLLHLDTVVLCWPNVKSLEQGGFLTNMSDYRFI